MRSSAILLAIASTCLAGFDPASKTNVALYWGQNSIGNPSAPAPEAQWQTRLGPYCDKNDVDIVIISFLTQFLVASNDVVLNLANLIGKCVPEPKATGVGSSKCSDVETDIKTCQETNQKTVLLSFGGDSAATAMFKNDGEATAMAEIVWAMFGPDKENKTISRPFGSASVDGFDFDFENAEAAKYMVPFATRLRALMDAEKSKKFYLTAAPQCPFPIVALNEILEAVHFDMVFVQFYNTGTCKAENFDSSLTTQTYNIEAWNKWAVSKKPPPKVFLGALGGESAGLSKEAGYMSADKLGPVIAYSKEFASFGGMMFWDASQVYAPAQDGFIGSIKDTLKATASGSAGATSAVATSAAASSAGASAK